MSKHTTLDQLKKAMLRAKTEIGKVETRVETLEQAGSQANVLEGVQVNGTLLTLANKIANILIAEGSANGTISVNNVDVAVKGLAALAYKAEVSPEELTATLKKQIDDATSDITTLKGTGAGSVKKAVDDALNEFATNVTNDDVVNTYKELIDWAASHGSDAAEMAAAISALEAKATLGTDGDGKEYATVKAYVEAVIAGLGMSNYYTKTEVDAELAKKVDKVTGKGLSTNDFTDAYKGQLEGLDDALDGKVDKVTGKGLSTNDFTDAYKTKLDGITDATDKEVEDMLDEVFGAASGT